MDTACQNKYALGEAIQNMTATPSAVAKLTSPITDRLIVFTLVVKYDGSITYQSDQLLSTSVH